MPIRIHIYNFTAYLQQYKYVFIVLQRIYANINTYLQFESIFTTI